MFKLTNRYSSCLIYFHVAVALSLVLFLFVAPAAMACHKDDVPHGKVSTCDNPNPDPPPTVVETYVAIHGDLISEILPPASPGRPCAKADIFDADRGDYNCSVSAYPGLMIDTIRMSGDGRPKALDLCHNLTHHVVLMPSESGFQYGWTDNCRDGDCDVEVRIVFEGEQILETTGNKADVLDVVMHAKVDTLDDDPLDSNPFYHSRDIDITSVDLDFKLTGSKKSAAKCTFYVPMACEIFCQPARLISIPVP